MSTEVFKVVSVFPDGSLHSRRSQRVLGGVTALTRDLLPEVYDVHYIPAHHVVPRVEGSRIYVFAYQDEAIQSVLDERHRCSDLDAFQVWRAEGFGELIDFPSLSMTTLHGMTTPWLERMLQAKDLPYHSQWWTVESICLRERVL